MIICAVRTFTVLAEGHNNLWSSGPKLTHEPKSDHRYALNLISADARQLIGSVGNYAECKHCGAIYSENTGG